MLGLYEFYQWHTSSFGYEFRTVVDAHEFHILAEKLRSYAGEMEIDFTGIEPTNITLKNSSGSHWQHYYGYTSLVRAGRCQQP